jgi:hypothetical protein
MAVLFDIDHEVGDLSEYDSTVTDGGDLSVTVAAALNTTSYGLQCVIDDTNDIYGEGNLVTPNTTGITRVRFFIDPNGFSIDNYQKLAVCRLYSSGASVAHIRVEGQPTAYNIVLGVWEDDGTYSESSTAMSDAEHCVEFQLARASSDVASDGEADAWLDGVALTSITELDNYDRFDDFDYVRLGAMDVHASTSGTIYEDELIVNDDGTEIGCEPPGRPRNPAAYYDGPTIF